jgi:hypothetical protein
VGFSQKTVYNIQPPFDRLRIPSQYPHSRTPLLSVLTQSNSGARPCSASSRCPLSLYRFVNLIAIILLSSVSPLNTILLLSFGPSCAIYLNGMGSSSPGYDRTQGKKQSPRSRSRSACSPSAGSLNCGRKYPAFQDHPQPEKETSHSTYLLVAVNLVWAERDRMDQR